MWSSLFLRVSSLFPAILGDFFGRTAVGSIVGFIFALAGSPAAFGSLIAGYLYTATSSYSAAFVLSAALNGAALLLLFFLKKTAKTNALAHESPSCQGRGRRRFSLGNSHEEQRKVWSHSPCSKYFIGIFYQQNDQPLRRSIPPQDSASGRFAAGGEYSPRANHSELSSWRLSGNV
jgi:MFS family permease